MEKALTPKGFRDYLPRQMRLRNFVVSILRQTFEKYGFEPLETPTLEYASTLLGKYGEEADRLVYTFKDKGDRDLGLNYDLTVPTARVLASYQQEIKLPFKRYQIQRAYRAEKPQKSRYREFTQCDIDIFGSSSPLADAEILAVINESLVAVGLTDFEIRINSRQVLFRILADSGVLETTLKMSAIQTLDKLGKISWDGVTSELIEKGLDNTQIKAIQEAVSVSQPDDVLNQVMSAAWQLGVPKERLVFSPTTARGLDYYTGVIFETVVTKAGIGSVTGGGRYDDLVKKLGGPDLPATGTTLGLDRLCDALSILYLVPEAVKGSAVTVLICLAEDAASVSNYALEVVKDLRSGGVASEIFLVSKSLDKQLKYASEKNIPWVVIIGDKEVTSNKLTVKNLKTRQQEELLLGEFKDRLAAS
jgi:histidyl-tRNA synthetase